MNWIETLALGPALTLAVLLAEHGVQRLLYGRTSALERLTVRLGRSGRIDWLFQLLLHVPTFTLRTALLLATPAGIAVLVASYATKRIEYGGLVPLEGWSAWAAIPLYLVVFDLVQYATHRALHRFEFLWQFHKLHHAAEEMTILNGARVSLFERSFNALALMLVMFVLIGMPRLELVVAVVLIRQLLELVQHTDLPWDYGVVGRVLASPRFHRIHHSSDPRDFGSHYGNLLSVWDHAFGTVSARYRVEGAQVADTVTLGLDDPAETRRLNRSVQALVNGTHLDFVLRYLKPLLLKIRPRRPAAP